VNFAYRLPKDKFDPRDDYGLRFDVMSTAEALIDPRVHQ